MSVQNVTTEQVYSALRKCMDPEIPVNVVDLGLIYGVKVNPENNVDIKMTMTTRGCPLHDTLVSDVKRYLGKINGIGNINVEIVWDPPWDIEKMDPEIRQKMGFGKPKLRFQLDYEKYQPLKRGQFIKQDDGSLILTNEKAAHRAALSGIPDWTYAGSFDSASLMRAHFVSSSLTSRSFAAG